MGDETKKEKAIHPNLGEVEIITKGEIETVVRLQSGETRTVTTEWLKPIDGNSTDKPA